MGYAPTRLSSDKHAPSTKASSHAA
jgi:hypothetical protein